MPEETLKELSDAINAIEFSNFVSQMNRNKLINLMKQLLEALKEG